MAEDLYIDNFQSIRAGNNWYRNIQFLGKGGNGIALLVTCTGGKFKGGLFALKLFYKISSDDRREKFLKEIQFMKNQYHSSLMKHYDEGEFKERPFVVMQYLPHTLWDEIKKGPISIGKGLVYALQLLSALKELNEKEIVHRDIKPQNIFINNYRAQLGDFGLIKNLKSDTDDPIEFNDYIAMPWYYRTPNLVAYSNGDDDLRLESDIFQLGLVLGHMFGGMNPLKEPEDKLDPIEIDKVGYIKGDYGTEIKSIIKDMIKIDIDDRITIDEALNRFNIVFEKFSKRKLKLDGQLFES
ncbi:serine/threonine protein kinase [Fodinibius roseus]|uniref:Serine/threonine protein kinase n=1 Tax=Fodinibius roseus TaxID=1194090 RepID=A0A1M5LZ45_9BACT|nr:protein kinase [Fodinibius roseus]SHG69949.1 serine/threonine protein kinase [Fodinibius roseus]